MVLGMGLSCRIRLRRGMVGFWKPVGFWGRSAFFIVFGLFLLLFFFWCGVFFLGGTRMIRLGWRVLFS